jgi:hypothetical protein
MRNVQTQARSGTVPRRKLANISSRKIVVFDGLWGLHGSADRVRGLHAFRHDPGGGCPGVDHSTGACLDISRQTSGFPWTQLITTEALTSTHTSRLILTLCLCACK